MLSTTQIGIAVIIICVILILAWNFVYKPRTRYVTNPKDSKQEYLITYVYSEGCPYCTEFKPVWEQLAKAGKWQSHLKFQAEDREKTTIADIDAVPFIGIAKKSDIPVFVAYSGERTFDKLFDWINKYIEGAESFSRVRRHRKL